jgi:hypothetical protein
MKVVRTQERYHESPRKRFIDPKRPTFAVTPRDWVTLEHYESGSLRPAPALADL